jgi:flagellar basal body-associated protein FliL
MKLIPKSKPALGALMLLIGALAGAGYFFLLKAPTTAPTAEKPVTVSFGAEITTNVGDQGHYARVTILADVLPSKAKLGPPDASGTNTYPTLMNEAEVRSIVNETFSQFTSSQLIGSAGQVRFREKLTKNLKDEAKLTVRRIYLTEWLVQ